MGEKRRRSLVDVTRTPPRLCPSCGYVLDAAAPAPGAAEEAPQPGDWTLCSQCTEPLRLGADLAAEKPGFGAYAALKISDPELHGELERGRARLRAYNAAAPGGGFGGGTETGRA